MNSELFSVNALGCHQPTAVLTSLRGLLHASSTQGLCLSTTAELSANEIFVVDDLPLDVPLESQLCTKSRPWIYIAASKEQYSPIIVRRCLCKTSRLQHATFAFFIGANCIRAYRADVTFNVDSVEFMRKIGAKGIWRPLPHDILEAFKIPVYI